MRSTAGAPETLEEVTNQAGAAVISIQRMSSRSDGVRRVLVDVRAERERTGILLDAAMAKRLGDELLWAALWAAGAPGQREEG